MGPGETNNCTSCLLFSFARIVGALGLLIIRGAFFLARTTSICTLGAPTLERFAIFATSLGVVFFAWSLRVGDSCWRDNKAWWWRWEWNDGRQTRSAVDMVLVLGKSSEKRI